MNSISKGIIIIFLSLALFFLFPLDSFIGIPQTALTSLKQFGIQTSFTFYSLFNVCQSPGVSVLFSQCGLVMFVSIIIFISIIFGIIFVAKGMVKGEETPKSKPKITKKSVETEKNMAVFGLVLGALFGWLTSRNVINFLHGDMTLITIFNILLLGAIGAGIGKLIKKK